MLNFRNALEIRHDDNSTFLDYKKEALDFSRDTFSITLDKDEDYLYIGFHKPINSIYADLSTPNTSSGAILGEYYNGTEFTTLVDYFDETDNFNRNGFITWRRNQDLEVETTIDSVEKYWYRFSTSVTHTETVFNAINILFSDDQALKMKFTKILDEDFLDGETNYNKIHAGVRDEVVESFKRKGYVKTDGTRDDVSIANITPWDMHDIYEVREAATFLALSKIFFDFSNDPEDIYMKKSIKYEELYEQNINLARISVDENDDGKMTESENLPVSKTTYISR